MHHDFRFLFAYTGSRTIRTDERESAGYEWLPLDDEYVRREILCTERARTHCWRPLLRGSDLGEG